MQIPKAQKDTDNLSEFLCFVICGVKVALEILMKMTPVVNFIIVLHSSFLYQRGLRSFSLVTFDFVIFGAKILYVKY